jgi:hypothetical protein
VFSTSVAVSAPATFWPAVNVGVRWHDSFGVPVVKLHEVVNMPAMTSPWPAAWLIRLSPVSTSTVLPGWVEYGGRA